MRTGKEPGVDHEVGVKAAVLKPKLITVAVAAGYGPPGRTRSPRVARSSWRLGRRVSTQRSASPAIVGGARSSPMPSVTPLPAGVLAALDS